MLFALMLALLPSSVHAAKQDFEAWARALEKDSVPIVEDFRPQAETLLSGESPKRCRVASLKSFSPSQEKRLPDLLIFVSFSLPMSTLQTLAEEAAKVGGKLVFRGLVEGNFPKTVRAFQRLKREALIDPTLFRKHGISQVPVFVQGSHRMAGNVSLSYALEHFARKGKG